MSNNQTTPGSQAFLKAQAAWKAIRTDPKAGQADKDKALAAFKAAVAQIGREKNLKTIITQFGR